MANALSLGFGDIAEAPQNRRKGGRYPSKPLTGWDAVEVANLSMVPGISDAASGALAVKEALAGNYGAAAMNALGVLPFLPAMAGAIKPLWHGSPHKFSKFDLSKIGAGEEYE